MANNCLKEKLDSLSQAEFSRETTVSTGTINKVCNKLRTPAPRTKRKIVNGLNKLADASYDVNKVFI